MNDAELGGGEKEKRGAQLLRKFARQIQRDAAKVCVA